MNIVKWIKRISFCLAILLFLSAFILDITGYSAAIGTIDYFWRCFGWAIVFGILSAGCHIIESGGLNE